MQLNSQDDTLLQDRVRSWMGTALMAVASLMTILVFADRTDAALFPLPGVWFATREFHILICLALFLMAAALLKGPSERQAAAVDNRPVFRRVRFFTRKGCHLCDAALQTLQPFQSWFGQFEIVDVDDSSEFRRLFGDSVPVVEMDGRIRFRGGVHPKLLQRLIDGRLRQLESALSGDTADDEHGSSGLPRPEAGRPE
jgi:glutaredoxin